MKKINYNERKKYLIRGSILLIIGIIALGLVIYFNLNNKDENPFEKDNKITDSIKFKKEYENLNNKKIDSNNKYLPISIDKNNPIKYILDKEVDEFLTDGTGIIYFGFPECPWCRNAVPVLIDALKEKDIKEIYYLNVKDIRDEKELDSNGNVKIKKEGTNVYKTILNKLNNHLKNYENLNDESIKRLYVPAVFFITNGEVVGVNYGTVSSQTNPMIPLSNGQYKELKNIYLENIDKVYNFKCNGSKGC